MTSGARPGREDRPDRIAQASARDATLSPAGGGKLRIYLGIAPGVGKTYAMLRDARARRRSGTDTVVAHWERHGRSATAAQLAAPNRLIGQAPWPPAADYRYKAPRHRGTWAADPYG